MAKKKVSKRKSKSVPQIQSFEESLAELEKIVSQLESGKLGLSDALSQYEAGDGYLKACHGQLAQAERRIELLCGVDAVQRWGHINRNNGQPQSTTYRWAASRCCRRKIRRRGRRWATLLESKGWTVFQRPRLPHCLSSPSACFPHGID